MVTGTAILTGVVGIGNLVVADDVAAITGDSIVVADVTGQGCRGGVQGVRIVRGIVDVPLMLDANGRHVVVPVSRMPGDVRLIHHLGDRAPGADHIMSRGPRRAILEPRDAPRVRALHGVDDHIVHIAEAPAVVRVVAGGRCGPGRRAIIIGAIPSVGIRNDSGEVRSQGLGHHHPAPGGLHHDSIVPGMKDSGGKRGSGGIQPCTAEALKGLHPHRGILNVFRIFCPSEQQAGPTPHVGKVPILQIGDRNPRSLRRLQQGRVEAVSESHQAVGVVHAFHAGMGIEARGLLGQGGKEPLGDPGLIGDDAQDGVIVGIRDGPRGDIQPLSSVGGGERGPGGHREGSQQAGEEKARAHGLSTPGRRPV